MLCSVFCNNISGLLLLLLQLAMLLFTVLHRVYLAGYSEHNLMHTRGIDIRLVCRQQTCTSTHLICKNYFQALNIVIVFLKWDVKPIM